jgi:hypothetical protein
MSVSAQVLGFVFGLVLAFPQQVFQRLRQRLYLAGARHAAAGRAAAAPPAVIYQNERFCRKFCNWLNPVEKTELAYPANK